MNMVAFNKCGKNETLKRGKGEWLKKLKNLIECALIEKLKFDGNREACEHFDPVEVISSEIDSPEEEQELSEGDEINISSSQELLWRRELKKMADPDYPLESYTKLLSSK